MAKNKKLTKKVVNLGGLSEKVYESLCINPTTKYAIKRTGKSKESVGRALKKLVDWGYIKRLSRGYYKVNQNLRGVTQVNHNNTKITERLQQNKKTKDYFRLHNLQVKIFLPSSFEKKLRNTVFQRRVFKNIRSSGATNGSNFNIGESVNTFSLTNKNLFIYYSEDYDIEGDTLEELDKNMYDSIMKELDILQSRFGITCFKDGKVLFDITNMHIALVRNGVAEYLRKDKKRVVYYDAIDHKPRVISDYSNLLDELEAVHPVKGRDDAYELQKTMGYMAEGKVNDTVERSDDFFNDSGDTSLSDLKKIIYELAKQVHNLSKENKETAAGLSSVVQLLKTQLPTEIKSKNIDKRPADYIG